MPVYVDRVRPCIPNPKWKYNRSCHLFADTEEELHALAAEIGLRREWFQKKPGRLPHYDLTAAKRNQAIRAGAIAAEDELLIAHVRRARGILEDLFRCPECGFTGTLDEFDVLGAADGNLFCPDCAAESPMLQAAFIPDPSAKREEDRTARPDEESS